MNKTKKMVIWISVLAVLVILALIDIFLNGSGSIKLIASIFLPGLVAPVGSSISDGLQYIAIIPDIWIVCLVIYGVTSSLRPKKSHSAAN